MLNILKTIEQQPNFRPMIFDDERPYEILLKAKLISQKECGQLYSLPSRLHTVVTNKFLYSYSVTSLYLNWFKPYIMNHKNAHQVINRLVKFYSDEHVIFID